jgi:Rrf2 family protein
MKVNTRARYALRMMADIMKHDDGDPVPLKDVAKRENLSQRYLSQLAIHLKNAQLLKSVWGMNGGYRLARPAEEIRILDIFQAVEGPISVLDCLMDPNICPRYDYCDCVYLWRDINDGITNTLGKYTLRDLTKGDRPC